MLVPDDKQAYFFSEITRYFAPPLSNKIRKSKQNKTEFKTYPALREYGHKVIADFKTGIVQHWKTIRRLVGEKVELDIEKEFYSMGKSENGCFNLTKIQG